MGAWVRAALNSPRGLYTERTREIARNGAAVMGMIGFFALYYSARTLPIIALGLAGYVLIAYFKPQAALALVAFSIPFFWYPKVYGSQHFPIAETLILLAFAALVARRATAFFLPGLWTRVSSSVIAARQANVGPIPAPIAAAEPKSRVTRPIPLDDIAGTPAAPSPEDVAVGNSDLASVRWPARPKALIAELATPLPLPTTELPKPTRKRERSNIAVAATRHAKPSPYAIWPGIGKTLSPRLPSRSS